MAATKTFQTLFNIAAKYTGKPAFAAVNRDLTTSRVGRSAFSFFRSLCRIECRSRS